MPFVNIRTAKGLLRPEQKKELQSRVTDLIVEIEGRGNPDFARFVMVLVEEHEADAWCIQGDSLSAAAVEALAASL